MPLSSPIFLIQRGPPDEALWAIGPSAAARLQINLDHVVIVRRQITTPPDFRPEAKADHGVPPARGIYEVTVGGTTGVAILVLIDANSTLAFWG